MVIQRSEENILEKISSTFINYASSVLGATDKGLSGSRIIEVLSGYAVDFSRELPYSTYPFPTGTANKRTVFQRNLEVFNSSEQFKIIRELCDSPHFEKNNEAQKLKMKLISSYSHWGFNTETELNKAIVDEVIHWLQDYPESLSLYKNAIAKLNANLFQRNILDDLRLSFELLVNTILNGDRSLENQVSQLGQFAQERKCSKEFVNMFVKLVDYYTKYQNAYVKHDDAVIENEIEMIFELTSVFMKFLVKIR